PSDRVAPRGARLATTNYQLPTTNYQLFVRQHPVQFRRVLISDLFHPAHLALRLGGLARENVALEGRAADDLARAGLLEPLCGAPMCLQFRHVCVSTLRPRPLPPR